MLFGLFVLPAAMVVFGRGLFWPFVPRVGDTPREGRFWGRVGEAVRRRPSLVGASATGLLVVMALGGIGVQVGLSQNEQFRVKPEAVLGQETLSSAFPAGASAPAAVITNPASVAAVVAAAKTVDGVVSATPGAASADVAQIDVVLSRRARAARSPTTRSARCARRSAPCRVPTRSSAATSRSGSTRRTRRSATRRS